MAAGIANKLLTRGDSKLITTGGKAAVRAGARSGSKAGAAADDAARAASRAGSRASGGETTVWPPNNGFHGVHKVTVLKPGPW